MQRHTVLSPDLESDEMSLVAIKSRTCRCSGATLWKTGDQCERRTIRIRTANCTSKK